MAFRKIYHREILVHATPHQIHGFSIDFDFTGLRFDTSNAEIDSVDVQHFRLISVDTFYDDIKNKNADFYVKNNLKID